MPLPCALSQVDQRRLMTSLYGQCRFRRLQVKNGKCGLRTRENRRKKRCPESQDSWPSGQRVVMGKCIVVDSTRFALRSVAPGESAPLQSRSRGRAVSVGDSRVGRIDAERGCQDDQVVLLVKENVADRLGECELVQRICLLDAPSIVYGLSPSRPPDRIEACLRRPWRS